MKVILSFPVLLTNQLPFNMSLCLKPKCQNNDDSKLTLVRQTGGEHELWTVDSKSQIISPGCGENGVLEFGDMAFLFYTYSQTDSENMPPEPKSLSISFFNDSCF